MTAKKLLEIPMLMPTQIPVLVAHAEPMVHRGIVATLKEDSRFQVLEAGVGAQWLEQHCRPDDSIRVLVTSLLAGIEAATAFRRDGGPRRAHPTAVLVVAPVDSEMSVRGALQAGVSGFLPQTCQASQLIDAASALSRGQRYLDRSVAERLADAMLQELPTPREANVLQFMAAGLCNKAIAAELNISAGTVKAHVKALLQKLDAATRTEAADVAKRRGLLDPVGAGLASALARKREAGARLLYDRSPGSPALHANAGWPSGSTC